jgi:hypothetical protein
VSASIFLTFLLLMPFVYHGTAIRRKPLPTAQMHRHGKRPPGLDFMIENMRKST